MSIKLANEINETRETVHNFVENLVKIQRQLNDLEQRIEALEPKKKRKSKAA